LVDGVVKDEAEAARYVSGGICEETKRSRRFGDPNVCPDG
jgi:hypothetical protein